MMFAIPEIESTILTKNFFQHSNLFVHPSFISRDVQNYPPSIFLQAQGLGMITVSKQVLEKVSCFTVVKNQNKPKSQNMSPKF